MSARVLMLEDEPRPRWDLRLMYGAGVTRVLPVESAPYIDHPPIQRTSIAEWWRSFKRLQFLRAQAKRKGRPGWKHMRKPR